MRPFPAFERRRAYRDVYQALVGCITLDERGRRVNLVLTLHFLGICAALIDELTVILRTGDVVAHKG